MTLNDSFSSGGLFTTGREVAAGHVSGSYVTVLFDWLGQAHPELLGRMPFARPRPGELNRVAVDVWGAMLQWVFEQTGDWGFPLKVAESIKPANTGLLGYIASCCDSLGEAFVRLQQFENLIYSVNALRVEDRGGNVGLIWGVEKVRPGHWVDSVAIASLLAFSRGLVEGPLHPLKVEFVNPAPPNIDEFEAFFACEVQFDQVQTEVRLSADLLGCGLKSPDGTMRQLLEHQASQLLEQVRAGQEPLPGLRRAIQDSVTAGLPNLAGVARRLNLSERTLQRRLQEEGLSFRGCLEQVRIQMGKTCLLAGELSLADVALLLGYNDQSAFTHAFKKSTGVTPSCFRKMNR